MLNTDWSTSRGVNFQKYAVRAGEYLFIADGFALVTWRGVFRIDGYLRVDGILQVKS
jgi:hypothetical protein